MQLKKYNAAFVIVEELLSQGFNDAELFLLNARLLYINNDYKEAYEYYKKAVSTNPYLADKQFEQHEEEEIIRIALHRSDLGKRHG